MIASEVHSGVRLEKSFTVMVEMASGEKRTLKLHGESAGSAFQQAKSTPGVRRVGKIVEGDASPEVSSHDQREQKVSESRGISQYMNVGPRVVAYVRPVTGEQPFKSLYIPPERLAVPKPKPPVQPIRAEVPMNRAEPTAAPPTKSTLDYRVMKSRRQNGDPFLLQRGTWNEQDGKRTFSVEWEKGFPDREKAAAHQQWIVKTAAEAAGTEEE